MNPTILVIDDNPKIKESLELAFSEYEFLGALGGEEGLKYLRKPNDIDLVILDYRLGAGADGISVLREIRRLNADIGVMMLTSFGSKELVVEALREHADDFIDKPFAADDMKTKLEKFFEKLDTRTKDSDERADPMKRVLRFIERNFKKDLTLEDVAKKVRLSPKYLSRKFKRETRQTFSDYRVGLRIGQAKKLLRESRLGITQIAYKVGYENGESFMKMFKKTAGCTPTEFRQKENVQ